MSEGEKVQPKTGAATVIMPSPPAGNWQFGIRHLLGLMTYVAVMLGIATWQGPQTLMVTTGLGLALLSHLGAFKRLQTGRNQLVLVGLAWVFYLVSLCTPCMTGTFTVYGWQAAWIYFYGPVEAMLRKESGFEVFAWPWIVTIDMSNVLQAVLPLLIWRLSRERGQVLSVLSCLAMVGPWTTLVMASDLYIAYYIWCASFMLLAMAVPVNRPTLMGMAALAVVHIAIFRVFGTAP
ncbi:MAG: hypothetical protein K8R36_19420 [Planctomycetales bacterium]|nr:hypothetical protein [Planctomycetales bacterium]